MRYLFASLSSYGFLLPAIGLAQTLRERGHQVAFVCDPSMAPALGRAGLERIPRGEPDGRSFQIVLSGHPLESARQVTHLDYAIAKFKPDVLVGHELALGPVLAGERHGLPAAVVGLATFIWSSDSTVGNDWRNYREFVDERYQGFLESYHLTREMLHMPPRPVAAHDENPLLGDLFLLRSIPELEGESETLPARVHLVGDLAYGSTAPEPELQAWMDEAGAAGLPIVYAQPGRFFEKQGLWEALADALADRPVRVAASVGRMDRETSRIPPNFFVRDHVPQELVLPHATTVLCTSTTTPVLGALTHGLPLLLVPGGGGGEQTDLAIRCLRLGVAHDLKAAEVTAETLGALVSRLLDPEDRTRRSARRLQQAFRAAGGLPLAADLLERLARERAPVLRAGATVSEPTVA
jgi:MGT family glycosyltransferase